MHVLLDILYRSDVAICIAKYFPSFLTLVVTSFQQGLNYFAVFPKSYFLLHKTDFETEFSHKLMK